MDPVSPEELRIMEEAARQAPLPAGDPELWTRMGRHADRQGKPIDMKTWSLLLEDQRYRVVRHTKSKGEYVSTIWTGIRTPYYEALFETAIGRGTEVKVQNHYATEEAAIAGHEAIVRKVFPDA